MRNILVTAALLLASCTQWNSPQVNSTVTALKDDTVILYEGGKLHCAGVWIGPHTILTANHCVRHAGMPADILEMCHLDDDLCPEDWDAVGQTVRFRGQDMRLDGDGRVTLQSVVHDLALIDTGKVHSYGWATVSMAADVQDGDPLHIVGHPDGVEWTYTHGYVAAPHRDVNMFKSHADWMQVCAPIWGGNSGGGAFTMEGRLVGIASFIRADAPSMGFFVPLHTVQDFVYGRL